MAGANFSLLLLSLLFSISAFLQIGGGVASSRPRVCVIGGGIAGSSVSHFLKEYSGGAVDDIVILERNGVVGGRMATINLGGDIFEAGGTILHPKNLHALNFTTFLHLQRKVNGAAASSNSNASSPSSSWLGIWDGRGFVFKTLNPPPRSSSAIYKKIHSFLNALLIFRRYGFSLLRMNRFVQRMLERFLLYYKDLASRPVFGSVEDMLKWSDLYGLTRRTLREELADAGLSPLLISELVTVIMRINYGQDVNISGLAGAVSLAGSDPGLWSVEGGNWQIAAGLIKHANASLHLHEEITSISYSGGNYELSSKKGNHYSCGVVVIATPLDELNISFTPSVSIPSRNLQHTHATFVRGLLNPAYFGATSAAEIPNLVGTLEVANIPFSSISVLKIYSEEDKAYKVFSRLPMEDSLLDRIFSARKYTVRINWPAYPHYKAPENFAPYLLDGQHLYYINSFENAASTIETGAVAAENVARLILSRMLDISSSSSNIRTVSSGQRDLHVDL
ncbi:hypothetical protein Taro_014532 [Colocasia esculenta]|uniref:Prenylcysteine lyase domain-containing protein n=1 Tax=Colocasia esculenta TaxID=4460 RepID=A0A843UJ07_COLES|nr:hypothetical protein [Colocasia esculenta]